MIDKKEKGTKKFLITRKRKFKEYENWKATQLEGKISQREINKVNTEIWAKTIMNALKKIINK